MNAEKNKFVARAKVKRLSGESLAKLTIPVPPIEEQARIVAILDKFDALVNDLSSAACPPRSPRDGSSTRTTATGC